MSETKWTPGPWVNGCDKNGKPIKFAKEPDDWCAFPNPIALANRRLADAAPELYDALFDLLSICETDCDEAEECAWARAALAKARGES